MKLYRIKWIHRISLVRGHGRWSPDLTMLENAIKGAAQCHPSIIHRIETIDLGDDVTLEPPEEPMVPHVPFMLQRFYDSALWIPDERLFAGSDRPTLRPRNMKREWKRKRRTRR